MIDVNRRIAQGLAQEAGVSLPQTVAKHGGDWSRAVAELSEMVFAKRGWHYVSDFSSVTAGARVNVGALVSRVLTNSRTALAAAARRGRLTKEAFTGTRLGGVTGPSAAQMQRDIEVLRGSRPRIRASSRP